MANKIEKQIIEQINRADHLNEGFLSSAFIKVMFSKKAKKAFKKTGKEMKKDKNFKAAVIDLKKSQDRLNDLISNYCDRYPDAAQCD